MTTPTDYAPIGDIFVDLVSLSLSKKMASITAGALNVIDHFVQW